VLKAFAALLRPVVLLSNALAPLCRLTGMLQIAASIAAITLLELGDCLGGSYGRLLWMAGISGKGELAPGKQADCDKTTC
jgi:hypothetical protein